MDMWIYFVLTTLVGMVLSNHQHDAQTLQLLQEAVNHLDKIIRESIDTGLVAAEKRVKALVIKSDLIQYEAAKEIESNTFKVGITYQKFAIALEHMDYENVSSCTDDFPKNLVGFQGKMMPKLMKTVAAKVAYIQNTLTRFFPELIPLQNKTSDVRKELKICTYHNDWECIDRLFEDVYALTSLIPAAVTAVIDRIGFQLEVYESDLKESTQKIVNAVVERHHHFMFDFIHCIM